MDINPEKFLTDCFLEAVRAAHPENILAPHLPADRSTPAIIIGAGKAASSMAAAFEKYWQGPVRGLVVTPYDHGEKCQSVEIIEASHPTPDAMSVNATKRILDLTKNLNDEDRVYALLSGGGSSLLCLPAQGIDFSEKKKINTELLKSGATIDEINCVRKHLSRIKGGRLAAHCYPAKLDTFAISDVVGDDPSVIASGPTVADQTTSADAIAILNGYNIEITASVMSWLNDPRSETLKAADPLLEKSSYKVICCANDALKRVEEYAKTLDINCINLGELGGDARELGQSHAALAKTVNLGKPAIIISGGETTVTLKGNGRGGRNCEYLLSLATSLEGENNIYALAADTDGIDGTEANAGAIITPDTIKRAQALELDLTTMLDHNDSYTAFKKLDDLIITGPTRTNVNDFRAILILPEN